jgi:hypothetical protein
MLTLPLTILVLRVSIVNDVCLVEAAVMPGFTMSS